MVPSRANSSGWMRKARMRNARTGTCLESLRLGLPRTALLLLLPLLAAGAEHPVSMWLAEGERNRVYILGSIHLLRQQDHPLPTVIDAAYEDAETLVMELDMDDIDPLALQAQTNRIGLLKDGRTLRQALGEERYAEAASAATALEIPLDMLQNTEPWFAAITVEQLVLLRIGFNPMLGVEMHLATRAGRDGKPITGLESVDEQLRLLDGLSMEAQGDLLLQTLEGGDAEEEMGRLIGAWRRGDIDFLETFMLEGIRENDELYETIVARRNRAWADDVVALLDDEEDYLLVVGALHLVGEDGLPALLQKRGVATRQMHESL
jgi:uncharacterized protein